LVARPNGGGCGHRIKVIQLEKTGGGLVVIAADKYFSQAAAAIDDIVRGGSVTYDVPEIRNEVEGWRGGQASLHGFEIGMNVAKQQYVQ
jgi:hypothetical protein